MATSRERIEARVEGWLAANIKRGWECVEQKEYQPVGGSPENPHPVEDTTIPQVESPDTEQGATSAAIRANGKEPPPAPTRAKTGGTGAKRGTDASRPPDTPRRGAISSTNIGISFSRSTSANFAIALRRAKALAANGALAVENDDKGRQSRFSLTLDSGIVENAVRIENLVRLVSSWRGTELSIGGEPVSRFEFDTLLEELGNLRRCRLWQKKKSSIGDKKHPCHNDSPLGCRRLRIEPNQDFLRFLNYSDMPWFAVGSFDGKVVTIDKAALRAQIGSSRNERLSLCPLFNRDAVLECIDKLPDVLDPKKDKRWGTVHSRKTGKPVWVLPEKMTLLPYDLTTKDRPEAAGRRPDEKHPNSSLKDTVPSRKIPPVRYSDICGQDAAVEAVRDYVELPVRHAALFKHVGVKSGNGILLYGPPGNGKTLLAKAVAGETDAHIEIVSGPEILSMWLGESERALRGVFERAREHAPSVILFDEIDSVAPAREAADAVHQKVLVSQLLVLLDGLEDRGRVFVIAATNRPEDIDPALKRPGRFDRLVYVGLPEETGRAATFKKYFSGMKTSPAVSPADLAAATPGFSGAQIEHACREAGLLCIKDAIRTGAPPDSIEVLPRHFHEAIRSIREQSAVGRNTRPAAAPVLACQN
ncbi:MAG: ATP-binding protein [bacterium]